MVDKAWQNVWDNVPVGARTRAGHKQFKACINDVEALNVTTRAVNMIKMGAMRKFNNSK